MLGANAYDGEGRCARDGMHAGMDVREVAEIIVLQEGGRPVRKVILWLRAERRLVCDRRECRRERMQVDRPEIAKFSQFR